MVDGPLDQPHVDGVLHHHPLVAVEQVERRNGFQVVELPIADDAPLVVGIDPARGNLRTVFLPLGEVFVGEEREKSIC